MLGAMTQNLRHSRITVGIAMSALVVSLVGLGAGGVALAAKYDAQNAHKVDGLHAVKSGAGLAKRKGKLVATNSKGRFPGSVAPVTKQVLTLQAQGLNISDGGNPARLDGGLNWDYNFAGGANIWLPRPVGWDGGTVTVKVLFLTDTASGGDVQFFVRPRDYNPGDPFLDAGSILSNLVNVDAGASRYFTATATIPGSALPKSIWNIGLQRNSGFAGGHADEVIVQSVTLEYRSVS